MKSPAWTTHWDVNGMIHKVTVRATDENEARRTGFIKLIESQKVSSPSVLCVSCVRLRGAKRRST